MAKETLLLSTLVCLLLLINEGQLVTSVNIDDLDIQLVNGSTPNEGRVLVRWLPDIPWTAVCFQPFFGEAIPFQMCRSLGYSFACGQDYAGPRRTDIASLENVASTWFFTACSADQTDMRAGGCDFFRLPDEDANQAPACTHEQDMWLSCGYGGMPDFELRLVDGSPKDTAGLLEGRCGPGFEWRAVCGNWFQYLKEGRVACRELGYSDYAVDSRTPELSSLADERRPTSTLFVDVGCVGNETSLTECLHYSLRECQYYVTLECYTSITEYDETSYLCGSKQLCGSQCDQKHPLVNTSDNIFHYCQCDDTCGLFDDCCYDYERQCRQGEPSLSYGGFEAGQLGCVWVPGSQFTHIGYVVVNQCPFSWIDEGTRDLCERPVDDEDVIGSLPLYDGRGVDFKNIFCALCNGRSLESLKAWEVSASNNVLRASEERFHRGLNRTLPTKGWVITPPHTHPVIRKCPAHLVDTCLREFRGTSVEVACGAYYAPVKLDDSDTRYRNPHCALCNGETVVPDNSCMDQVCLVTCVPEPFAPCQGFCSPYDEFLTIEILFDLSSSSSLVDGVSCLQGQIYDPFLERCRVLSCAAGYRIRGDECVVAQQVPPRNDSNSQALECLLTALGQNASQSENFGADQILTVDDDASPGTSSVYVVVGSSIEALRLERSLDVVIEASKYAFLQSQQFPCNVSNWSIFLPFASNVSRTCLNSTVEASVLFPGQSGTLLAVVKYQNASGGQVYRKEKTSHLCLKITELNCSSLLTLEDFEYMILPEENIEIVATGTVLSSSEYVLFPDYGSLVVCSFTGSVPEGLEPQVRRAISFVGSLLSLFALAATFVTYCVFPKLRNDAGKSIMNLAVALFAAILLFLLSGYLRLNRVACEIGAASAHLAWLAAFVWMSMLAVDVARTFTSRIPRIHRGRTCGISRSLLTYACLGWGLPLAVVTSCLVIQYCNCTDLEGVYAQGDICWISHPSFLWGAFVGPVALCLILNVCLFVFTTISIRRSREASKVARKNDDAKEELAIYAKLCSLMGVTWVFGFISQSVSGVVVFSYLYILLNYLQGVFIFVAFCLNKRVRGMWRDKMGKGRREKPRKDGSKDLKVNEIEPNRTASSSNMVTEETKL